MSSMLLTSGPPSPDWITPTNTPHNILATYGGWVHMYAVFMTLAMILSVLACFIRLKIKKVPIEPLIWSIFVIIPFSLFGASFFGKVNNDVNNPWVTEPGAVPFWSLFAFWKAGMSIHGGVLFGTITGLIVFGIVGRKSKVSLWVYTDAIIPNILLGQVLGRWGNFFNHELLGSVTSYDSLRWLPAFIRDNLWQWDGLSPETSGGEVVFRQPIFLYESFFNFLAWLFITFFIPVAGQLFSKKPWKKNPKEYPFDLKYNFVHFFNRKYLKKDKMTWKEVWDKAYFNYVPTQKQLDEMPKRTIIETKSEVVNTFKKWWHNDSAELTKLNNPGRYTITRSGVQTGFYFFLWNLIRFVLETQRDDLSTLFIKNYRALDYAVLILISVLGLVLAIYAQWGAPRKFRKNGFIYEKEYVDFESLQTWKFDKYLTNNIVIGEDNYIDKLPTIIKAKVMEFLGYQDESFDKYFELKYFKANDQVLTNNEITNYGFKIVALPTANNKFVDDLVVNQTYKIDLSKVLKQATLNLTKPANNQYLTLSSQQFGTLLNNLVHQDEIMGQIKAIWNRFYPNINEKKTTIFDLNLNEFMNFDELKISPMAKKIEVSKFKFKENQFYYFNKKVCFKLNWQ
ncbi:prolipoprotein diacylglyceryl transferase [Spiroplasma sp. SV19]|uniref:prolipoprotein diacylglyceryl transferase n=1 Tax=Spiroplasma sp. SV19 TaxID=2570468 RepID=UPI0024B7DDB3|nr:prolipoprotein diacylglyceryl transferase [Spiroplasma sp. SV19]WHQ36746.1 prolipoprotein diacylglyceryl transferase [Spiroplasma sp. SV19]